MSEAKNAETSVRLTEENTRGIRALADTFASTPPRIVNRIVEDFLMNKPSERKVVLSKKKATA